eukprot:UN11493
MKHARFNNNTNINTQLETNVLNESDETLTYYKINIQQEILQNIHQEVYHDCMLKLKATKKSDSKTANLNRALHYGIKRNSCIDAQHLLALILFTDLSKLSSHFSATFGAINAKESVNSIKNRNREFAHWSRLLYETVEYYGHGTKIGKGRNKNATFYCGMPLIYMEPFQIRLNAPTSTTIQPARMSNSWKDRNHGMHVPVKYNNKLLKNVTHNYRKKGKKMMSKKCQHKKRKYTKKSHKFMYHRW